MSHVLSSADLEQASRAIEVLTSPLDHTSIDAWRSGVNTTLGKVLRADSAGFLLPVPDGPFVYSDEHDPGELAAYPDLPPPPAAGGIPGWEQLLRQRVGTLETLYGDELDGYMSSAYYNEYAAPNRAHDTLGLALSLGAVDIGDMASVQFWHSDPRGRRFGDRELALLRLVAPAFDAGVRLAMRTMCDHAALLSQIDAQRDGALVFDHDGRLLHRNAAVAALVWTPREERDLIAAARDMACGLATGRSAVKATPCGRIPGRDGDLLLRAVRFSEGLLGPQGGVLVTVEPAAAAPPEPDVLRQEFGLTKRQAQVALLLDQRKSNGEIADLLCISPHTARRHTEAVMRKLGVTDRREIRPRLRLPTEVEPSDIVYGEDDRLSA